MRQMTQEQTIRVALEAACRPTRDQPGDPVDWVARLPEGDVTLSNSWVLRRITKGKLAGAMTQIGVTDLPLALAEYVGPQDLTVMATIDLTPHGTLLHVSLSFPHRDPSWGVIKKVRYAFYPRHVDVAMVLPDDRDYVNVDSHCFQMWQMPVKWGMM